MKKHLLYYSLSLLMLVGLFIPAQAQISFGGKPDSFLWQRVPDRNNFPEPVIMPSFDLDKVLKQDEEERQRKDIPPRFGYPFDVDYNLHESFAKVNFKVKHPIYKVVKSVDVYQMHIKSPGALTINLQFNDFKLEENVEMFIYKADGSQVLGAFTSRNNKPHGVFATGLIDGDEVIIELNGSEEAIEKSNFTISRIVHGYRGLKAGFGTSGSCNNNVNCPEGDPWRDEQRGVVMTLTGSGTRWCSGSMINNAREDGAPYLLTANHCLTSGVNSWIIMFNYESPDCAGLSDGPTTQTLQGTTLLATWEQSDFALLLLDDVPPASYNTYYNGWSNSNSAEDSVVGMHHPDGDVKKISFDYDSIRESGYFSQGNDHWEVIDWNDGTTEGGSSGSPLFNKYHHIIGQLHGGDAACGNDWEDYYGKTWYSWDKNSNITEQLKYWLDPLDEGLTTLDGRDFNVPEDSMDAALSYLDDDVFFCASTLKPVAKIRNLGTDTLFSALVITEINGVLDTTIWTGSLATFEEEELNIPTVLIESGTNELKVYLSMPNDSLVDDSQRNDTIIRYVQGGEKVELNINTDLFGVQTGVHVYDANGDTLYGRIGFDDLTFTTKELCLDTGCYEIVVTDAAKNGMCCDFGNGYVHLSVGNVPVTSVSEFADSVIITLCIESNNFNTEVVYKSIPEELMKGSLDVYPNPTEGVIYIKSTDLKYGTPVQLYSVDGRKVAELPAGVLTTKMDISDLENGIYYLHAQGEKLWYMEKIVLVK